MCVLPVFSGAGVCVWQHIDCAREDQGRVALCPMWGCWQWDDASLLILRRGRGLWELAACAGFQCIASLDCGTVANRKQVPLVFKIADMGSLCFDDCLEHFT